VSVYQLSLSLSLSPFFLGIGRFFMLLASNKTMFFCFVAVVVVVYSITVCKENH